jgi:hypothetical protein
MFLWTIKWVIVSIILILLIHNIFIFLKDSLTIPKTRDLVSMDARYQELNESARITTEKKEPENNVSVTKPSAMEYELKDYLNNIGNNAESSNNADSSKNTDDSTTSVTDIESIINLNKPD